VDIDPVDEMIYWVDSYDRNIRRSFMLEAQKGKVQAGKFEHFETPIVISDERRIEALDIDPVDEIIYWVDSYDRNIRRSFMLEAQKGQVQAGKFKHFETPIVMVISGVLWSSESWELKPSVIPIRPWKLL
jgi:hypothetical protein